MVYAQPRIRLLKWNTQNSLEFSNTKESSNPNQTTRPNDNQRKKKRTCRIGNFAVPAYHKVKLKEGEKRDKNSNLARELKKKLWNMKFTVIPIVIRRSGAITKRLVERVEDLEIRGWVETIQTSVSLRSARILRSVPEDLRTLAVTQTPVENHQLTLVWKTLKLVK